MVEPPEILVKTASLLLNQDSYTNNNGNRLAPRLTQHIHDCFAIIAQQVQEDLVVI